MRRILLPRGEGAGGPRTSEVSLTMSESLKEGREGDPGVAQRIADTGRQFELALQASLHGGLRPDIDLLLAGADLAEREKLKEALVQCVRRHAERKQCYALAMRGGSPPKTNH